MQQSSIHYKNIKVMTNLLIHNSDSLKISYKKANVLRTSSSRRHNIQLSVSEDVGDSGPWDEQHTISASMYRRLTCRTTYRVPLQ